VEQRHGSHDEPEWLHASFQPYGLY
jgi:hypothetical protein